jgi:hypothetical protein
LKGYKKVKQKISSHCKLIENHILEENENEGEGE